MNTFSTLYLAVTAAALVTAPKLLIRNHTNVISALTGRTAHRPGRIRNDRPAGGPEDKNKL